MNSLLVLAASVMSTAMSSTAPSIQHGPFGKTKDGEAVELYTLTNAKGAVVKIATYGGIVTEIHVPDKNGKLGDVVLGFDTITPYETQSPYFGAIVGRVANRIAKGKFSLDGKDYTLAVNNGPNSLHGGLKAYDKRIWKAKAQETAGGPSLQLTLRDPDGSEGYPGNVDLAVVYTLTNDNTLRIAYTAKTDKATPINLTNHSYFNLKDAGKSDVKGHVLKLEADQYTPVDDTLIPTGDLAPVAGTAIDFTTAKPIGQDLDKMGGDPPGYDHNLVVRGKAGTLRRAAEVVEPTTGRRMEVYTTEPGVQLYTGNFLDGTVKGKGGVAYSRHHAFCLETQHYPDSINQPKFPSVVLRPNETYHQITEYRFSVAK